MKLLRSIDRACGIAARGLPPGTAGCDEGRGGGAKPVRLSAHPCDAAALQRQGIAMNIKKLRRLYGEEKLQVRKRGGRKMALGTRRPMLVPDRSNQRWSLDFVSDAFTDGRRFRVLTVVDDHTQDSP